MEATKESSGDKWQEENEYIQGLFRDSKIAPALKNLITRKIDHFSSKMLTPGGAPSVEFYSGSIHGLVSLYKDLFKYLSHGRNLLLHEENKLHFDAEKRARREAEEASRPDVEPQPYRRDLG